MVSFYPLASVIVCRHTNALIEGPSWVGQGKVVVVVGHTLIYKFFCVIFRLCQKRVYNVYVIVLFVMLHSFYHLVIMIMRFGEVYVTRTSRPHF